MSEKVLHIVQQFEKQGKKLIAGRAMEFKTTREAVARAERDAERVAGVDALTQVVDADTGEVMEEPVILARHGELPAEFQPDN